MITASRMAAVDRNAAALGVPRKQLMESSGNAVARRVKSMVDPGATVDLVCGRGNNGGDAFAAARFLTDYDVTVHLLGRPESITTDIARANWDALGRAEIATRSVTDSRDLSLSADADLLVDAMLGTGIAGDLRNPERSAARALNDHDAPVLAVDVPTGVDADLPLDAQPDRLTVAADAVVTFHDTKPALADREDLAVTVADIGIPAAAERFTGPGDLLGLDRDPRSHKGDHGDVLVVGGGPYTGAPALTARAALRAGADLARVACPQSVASEVQGFSEDLIVHPLPGAELAPVHVEELLERAGGVDCVVLGPGLGGAEATREAVADFLDQYDGRAVVDADALQVVPTVDTDADLLCTPHQGELRNMGGQTDDDWERRADLVTDFAADLGATLLVKGAYDVISDGERTRANRTGNPGMTVGGTGDCLAGVCGALAASTDPEHDLFDAGAIAAYVNGRAGDIVADERGHGLVATDIVDAIPRAMEDADDD